MNVDPPDLVPCTCPVALLACWISNEQLQRLVVEPFETYIFSSRDHHPNIPVEWIKSE
jgi:hypothetical protein